MKCLFMKNTCNVLLNKLPFNQKTLCHIIWRENIVLARGSKMAITIYAEGGGRGGE